MKIGMVIKKEFQSKYGKKKEIHAEEITIRRSGHYLTFRYAYMGSYQEDRIPTEAIQLLYIGGWND